MEKIIIALERKNFPEEKWMKMLSLEPMTRAEGWKSQMKEETTPKLRGKLGQTQGTENMDSLRWKTDVSLVIKLMLQQILLDENETESGNSETGKQAEPKEDG